jgi:predicted TIM-barrel fold metal-dependent hydrolase
MSDHRSVGEQPFDVRRMMTRADAPALTQVPITMVSADGHAMLPGRDYASYVDPKYRAELAAYVEFIDTTWIQTFDAAGYPFTADVLDRIDDRNAMREGGELGSCDATRRLREVEAEGVVAEILHPDGPLSLVPFFPSNYNVCTPELRAAGAVAHNRWLIDFCAADPKRLLGAHLIYPWPDMSAAVEQCRVAAEAGTKVIFPPQQAGVPGDPSPAFYDRSYDPLWAACQDYGLVVQIHAGWGNPQGGLGELMAAAATMAEDQLTSLIAEALDTFGERRPLWQFMFGGVFDRFPRLKVAFTEIHCDWVPGTLALLDDYARQHPGLLERLPSEYFERHCAVGASAMRYGDVAVRHEVGLSKLMFGTDYPHVEGTWPNTLDFIRETMREIPEDEVRLLLGGNAIEFFDLDRAYLDQCALRCGPMPAQLLGPDQSVDPFLVDHFDQRAGLRKSANLHLDKLLAQVEADVEQASAARAAAR